MHHRVKGQGIIEYALILMFVSVAAVLTITSLGTILIDAFQVAVDYLTGI